MLTWLDDFILGFFTRFCHWFQRLTGKTNFFLAKMVMLILSFNPLLHLVNYWVPLLGEETSLFEVFLFSLICFRFMKDAHDCDRIEDYFLNKSSLPVSILGFRNMFARLLFLFLSGYQFWQSYDMSPFHAALDRCLVVGFTIFVYLIAVDPLPPGVSRVREWIDNFLAAFRKPELAKSETSS